ncbi:hypothetical protein Sru01_59520 [Sphaerisporangium rufum]|uniref:Uncharacterized protein n=1 Tax=Sphaerisporangium rufum TaxID=1381558 RepID=A0A919V830_9ACTN|nr:hypothetical protein [Sphaerisporangium rufum]GII80970.1 hypothetical protein Sru01_59520 [Sphaerisporangium rufum]
MLGPLRGVLRTAAGLAVILSLTLPVPADAAGAGGGAPAAASRPGPPPVLDLPVSAQGFAVPGPNPRPSGPVTFRVSTTEAECMLLALFRVKPGATFEEMKKAFDDVESKDPAIYLQGLRDQYRTTTFAGGAQVYPGRPVTLTVSLEPGTYYMVAASSTGGVGVQTLEVSAERGTAVLPRYDAVIRFVQAGDRARLVLPRRLPAGGTFLIRNDSALPQEAIFAPTVPGTTYRTVQNYFDALRAGATLPPNPLHQNAAGLLAIDPGRFAVFHADFTPWRYSLLSFLAEPEHGEQQAYLGLHREFDFTAD